MAQVLFAELTPRQELTPTPYAIFAERSSNVSGTASTARLSGTLLDSQLTHSAVTLNAGPGLSGGGKKSNWARGDLVSIRLVQPDARTPRSWNKEGCTADRGCLAVPNFIILN